MYLDETYVAPFNKPGAIHHARFMGKALYYLKIMLHLRKSAVALDLSAERVKETMMMSDFISIFYASKFLSAEKSDIAAVQVNSKIVKNFKV